MSHWVSCGRVPLAGAATGYGQRSSREPGDVGRPRTGSRRDHANERSVDLDVTTSLRPPAAEYRGRTKSRMALPQSVEVHTHNGVPRSTWFRAIPRVSTWHRPYAVLLAGARLAATALAATPRSRSSSRPTPASQSDARQSSSRSSRTSCLPLGLADHAVGSRRVRPALPGRRRRTSSSGCSGPRSRSRRRCRSWPSPSRSHLSRLSVGTALLGGLVYIMVGRWLARRVLVLDPGPGPGGAPGAAGRHASPRRPTSTRPSPGCPAPGWCRSAST